MSCCCEETTSLENTNEKKTNDSCSKPIQCEVSNVQSNNKEMTKNQIKKMARREKLLEKMRSNRKQERQRRKERRKILAAKGELLHRKVKQMNCESASLIRVAVDMSFDHLMTDRDIAKLAKQLQRCYAENRRAAHALQLYITSFGGRSEQRFEKAVSGYRKWDVFRKSESYIDLFKKEEIVYLTSESNNVLTDLDPNFVYVIGGLVDHNCNKGLCFSLAVQMGIRHAQLPIEQHVKLASRKVLCVNHVFEILLAYVECQDWAKALHKVLPQRKVITKQTAHS